MREISLLEISQTYGLTGKLPGNPYLYQVVQPGESRLSEVHSRLTLFPNSSVWYVHDDYWSAAGEGLQNMTNSIFYAWQPRFQISVAHSYAPGFVDQTDGLTPYVRWKVYRCELPDLRYDLMNHAWINTLYSITYHPGCWGLTFTLMQDEDPERYELPSIFQFDGHHAKDRGAIALCQQDRQRNVLCNRTRIYQERTNMIDGATVKHLKLIPDERGRLMEILAATKTFLCGSVRST